MYRHLGAFIVLASCGFILAEANLIYGGNGKNYTAIKEAAAQIATNAANVGLSAAQTAINLAAQAAQTGMQAAQAGIATAAQAAGQGMGSAVNAMSSAANSAMSSVGKK